MEVMQSYLEKLGGNFLVAAMIPSLGFIIAVFIAFAPILRVSEHPQPSETPQATETQQQLEDFQTFGNIYSLTDNWLLLTILTGIVGFTLTALNTYILKLYEGYVFLYRFPRMKKAQIKKAKQLASKRDRLRKKIAAIDQRITTSTFVSNRTEKLRDKLKNKYYAAAAEYENRYPPLGYVLPTEFGNILRASEAYPGTRYGIDGVMLWPRLIHVIPPSYKNMIESARNELSFLVNLSLLSIIFSFLCGLAVLYTIFSPLLSIFLSAKVVPYELSYQYVFLGVVAIFLGLFFQKASLYSVSEFGAAIRSSYDLFRLDLLQQLSLHMPTDSYKEYDLWKNLTDWIILGHEHGLDIKPLHYDLTLMKNRSKE